MKSNIRFSDELETWLTSKQPKTLGSLQTVFGEKSFAIAFVLLMCIPSLPLPTGGLQHVFLVPVTWLLALEMIVARRSIWLPAQLKNRRLGSLIEKKALPFLLRRIRWFEKFARPRLAETLDHAIARTSIGVLVFVLATCVFIAPPFAGLDTLPALGVVIIGLGMILEDIVLLVIGCIVGLIGLGILIAGGAAIGALLSSIF